MEDVVAKKLEGVGVNLKVTLERFVGNEELYIKFLRKFLDDGNFEGLKKALADKNYEEAFNCSHTLKGVAANLGLDNLAKATSDIVEKLRVSDTAGLEPFMDRIVVQYDDAVEVIKSL